MYALGARHVPGKGTVFHGMFPKEPVVSLLLSPLTRPADALIVYWGMGFIADAGKVRGRCCFCHLCPAGSQETRLHQPRLGVR